MALSNDLEHAFAGSMTGKEVEVLVEQDNSGYTANYVRAVIESDVKIEAGTLYKGVVTAANGSDLIVK